MFNAPLLAAMFGLAINQFWYAFPLVISISLVYSATHHEAMKPILIHALRFGTWIVVIMALLAAVQALLFRWI